MSSNPPPPDFDEERTSWGDLDRDKPAEAQETDSASNWAQFQELSKPSVDAPTQPASMPMPLPKGDPRYAPTVPSALRRETQPAPVATSARNVTVAEAMNEVRRNDRVCPQPQEWQQLYQMLPGKKEQARDPEPPVPLTGSAWAITTAIAKRMCLRDHLEWADKKGCLPEVFAFLKSLPEESWHHAGD